MTYYKDKVASQEKIKQLIETQKSIELEAIQFLILETYGFSPYSTKVYVNLLASRGFCKYENGLVKSLEP